MARINSRFVTRLVEFAEQPQPADEFIIPEDLSVLSDEDLHTLHEQAVTNFDALYNGGQGLSEDDLAALARLTEGIEAISTEVASRSEAQTKREEEAAALAAKVHPQEDAESESDEKEPEAEAEGDKEPEAKGDAPEVKEGVIVEGTEPEQIAASARKEIRVNLNGLRGRTPTGLPKAGQAKTMKDLVRVSGEGTGYAAGVGVDWDGVGRIVDRRLAGYNASAYEAAARNERHMRQQFGVVTIHKPFEDGLVLKSNDPIHVDEVIRHAVDETRLPGGSLVAAGGWCAPSETIYDLLEIESRDGLYSLPEIGVSRGGINFTTGPDFATIYNAATGWHYTEQNDIDGHYSAGAVTNEVQTVTVTGTPTGGTFTLAFNGIPTPPIAYNATAAQVQAALTPVIGAQNITSVTGGPFPGTAVVVTFGGWYAGLDVAMMTLYSNSLTGGSNPTAGIAETTKGAVAANGDGTKPCYTVPCPSFTEVRLDLDGLCIKAGLLQQRGYPEMIARTVRGALVAHDHRLAGRLLRAVEAGSTAVTMPVPQQGTTAALLTSIELQVEHYRYVHRLSRGRSLEAVFPFWVKGAIRSDLARRNGVDMLSVSDAQIAAWFTQRGVNAQYVYNWQDLGGTAGTFTMWPSSVKFLLYVAGTWVHGSSDVITLDTIYDSTLLGTNDYTALFTEEGWLVAKTGFDSRVVTVPVFSDGSTGSQIDYYADGTVTAGSTAGITA